jgi:maltose O-acetyltransferase
VQVRASVRFIGTNVILDDGVGINSGVIFDHGAPIHLEKNVRVAYNVIFACAGHAIGPPEMRADEWYAKPIRVGEGTWIGANVLIMPGVSIAPGCVIAAYSFVNADLPAPNTLYVGTPPRAVRELDSPRPGGDPKAG